MFANLLRQRREIAENTRLRLLGPVWPYGTDGRFISLGHIRIRIPQPFDCAGRLDPRCCDFTFKEIRLLLHRESRELIECQLAL